MTTPVLQERHVHDVIEMMIEGGKTYNRESLKKEIIDTFGITTTFNSCSEKGMNADQAITFLDGRGKFTGTPEAFAFDLGKKCNH